MNLVVATQETVSRGEIRRFIRSYQNRGLRKEWYQNIRFGAWLETRRTFVDHLIQLVRPRVSKEEVVINNLPDLTGKRVVDIGCNAGAYSLAASARGASFVLGLDKSALRIEQAEGVCDIFQRMGRRLGEIEFRAVDDVMEELDVLDDMDVLMACCVLYHLGPLDRLKRRIENSSIKTLVLQGNLSRVPDEMGGNATDRSRRHGGVGDVAGLSVFSEKMGFMIDTIVEHEFPVVIAVR